MGSAKCPGPLIKILNPGNSFAPVLGIALKNPDRPFAEKYLDQAKARVLVPSFFIITFHYRLDLL